MVKLMAPTRTLLIVLALLLVLMTFAYVIAPDKVNKFTMAISDSELKNHKCTTCAGIDNLSDPAYNMKEVAGQSVLLEDHLTQKSKRCSDCIVKHFMAITFYIKEAVCLAGSKVNNYPLLEECTGYYQSLFDEFLNHQWDEEKMLAIADKLRDMRKKIVAQYILKAATT